MKPFLPVVGLAILFAGCQPSDAPASPGSTTPTAFVGAFAPDLASTETGALAVWVEDADAERHLMALPPNADAPVEVFAGSVSMHGQAGPRIATASDGTSYIAFVQEQTVEGRRFSASTLWLTRSEDQGTSWSVPVRVHPDPGFPTGHTFHNITAGPDGTVYVSWLDGTARDRWNLDQSTTAASSTDAPPIRLVHDGEDHSSDTPEPGTTLMVARSTDGGNTFETPVALAHGTCQCCRTAITATNDAVYATWRHIFPNGERDMALARSDDGGQTWNEPVRVFADAWAIDGCPHAGPDLAERADGALVVAWPTGVEGRSGIWSSVSTDRGETFAEPTALLANAPFGQVSVARDGQGRVWMAWEDTRTTEVLLTQNGGTDTLRMAGSAPALAGTPTGWHLARVTADGTRFTSGS